MKGLVTEMAFKYTKTVNDIGVVIGKFRFRFWFRPKFESEPNPKFRFRFILTFRFKPKFWFNIVLKTEIFVKQKKPLFTKIKKKKIIYFLQQIF